MAEHSQRPQIAPCGATPPGAAKCQAIGTDADERVGQVAEVVHVQHRTVHDKRIVADFNAVRTGMQIDTLVKIYVAPKPDLIGKADPDVILNRSNAIHPHEKSIA